MQAKVTDPIYSCKIHQNIKTYYEDFILVKLLLIIQLLFFEYHSLWMNLLAKQHLVCIGWQLYEWFFRIYNKIRFFLNLNFLHFGYKKSKLKNTSKPCSYCVKKISFSFSVENGFFITKNAFFVTFFRQYVEWEKNKYNCARYRNHFLHFIHKKFVDSFLMKKVFHKKE